MSIETPETLLDAQKVELWFDGHYRVHEPLKQYRQLQRDINKSDLMVGDQPLCTSPKPLFIPRLDRSVLTAATEAVDQILDRVATLLKLREDMSRFLGFDRRRHAFLFSDSGYSDAFPVVRYDTFYDVAAKELQFMEFNTHSPSSIGLHDRLITCIEKVPTICELTKQAPYQVDRLTGGLADALMESYHRYCRQKGQPVRENPLIVVIASEHSTIKNDVLQIASLLKTMGMQCEFAYPQQLSNASGDLSLNGKIVDIIYRDAIHDFAVPLFSTRDKLRYSIQYLAKCLIKQEPIEVGNFKSIFHDYFYLKASTLARACREAAVCLVNPLFSYMLSSKLVLALLHENRFHDQFTFEQKNAIEKYIPWTHVLKDVRTKYHGDAVSLVDLVKSNKNRFVIKPALGYGGYGVVIGYKTSQKIWNRKIASAIKPNRLAVVQDLIAIPGYRFPNAGDGHDAEFKKFNINLNLWSFNGQFRGAFARATEGAVINLHAGGMLIPVFYI